jgi:uncharacterized protein YukE
MSGSVRISADTSKLRAAARVIDSQMSIITSCFASIRDDVNMLKGRDWEGDSAETYVMIMDKLINEHPVSDVVTSGTVVQALRDYSEILNNAAEAFDKTDVEQENRINRLKTAIFNE